MNEETKSRAHQFVKTHESDTDERQQAHDFMRDFYEIFGVPTEKIQLGFEQRVYIDGQVKFIDHLLGGILLIEMKSRNQTSLDKAYEQAKRYIMNLNKDDVPKYMMLSNFERIQLFDLNNPENNRDFPTEDLPKHLDAFGFLLGRDSSKNEQNIDPVNVKAAALLEKIHRGIIAANYPANFANLLMTRLVFCFFADDTQIFRDQLFDEFLRNETADNGADLIAKLAELFQVLNLKPAERPTAMGIFAEFPYINGGLFQAPQPTFGLQMTSEVRDNLLKVAELDWSKISPVIFGSMFEGAMDSQRRHDLGAHYTSETNILKVVNSLFMDDLRAEFREIKNRKVNRKQLLENFHEKLANLKFLDPACGSGNFLIVAYRELRRLEHEVIEAKNAGNRIISIELEMKIEVAQFYGIEIVPYACSVARLGLWLMDHLMNIEASYNFGQYFARLPLHSGGNIACADALTVDWIHVFDAPIDDIDFIPLKSADNLDYILGNPPFIGNSVLDIGGDQKDNLNEVLTKFGLKKIGHLDFVLGWHAKATELIASNSQIRVALVSTNSISQGEQAATFWKHIFDKNVEISFAHQTFKWDNNGAAVFVVIIGLAKEGTTSQKNLFTYDDVKGNSQKVKVSHINQYLIDAPNIYIEQTKNPLHDFPKMQLGSLILDSQNYIVNETEKSEILAQEPNLEKYLHPLIGSRELLQNQKRFVFYLKDAALSDLRTSRILQERISKVVAFRKTVAAVDQPLAETPTIYKTDKYNRSNIMVIPRVSSENRDYAPMGYFGDDVIVTDAAYQIPNATLDLFALLQSKMHMAWLNTVGGRLKGDYRYSNTLVYNTFVVPEISDETRAKLIAAAENILTIREKYTAQGNSLADMYNPLLMPADLRRAHNENDKLVDSIYGLRNPSGEERVAGLMGLYEERKGKNKH